MAVLYSNPKTCPTCGKPMTAVPDDVVQGRQRYVCTPCEDDPLHDPAARKWADRRNLARARGQECANSGT